MDHEMLTKDAQDEVASALPAETKREVILHKAAGEPLGLSIRGVLALFSSPWVMLTFVGGREEKLPILISEIKEEGALDRTRACYVGDAILAVRYHA